MGCKTVVTVLNILMAILFVSFSVVAAGQLAEENQTIPIVVAPDVKPLVVKESIFDSEDFEIGFFAGIQSIEDFGSDTTLGARLAYHVSESFFVEAAFAEATAGISSFEALSGSTVLLTEDERDYSYYSLSLAYNLFLGEAFFSKNRTFNTSFYLMAGIGNTDFAGDEWFTTSIGFGYRVILTDWMLWHVDVKDHIFDLDLLGEDKTTHNLQMTTGLAFFF